MYLISRFDRNICIRKRLVNSLTDIEMNVLQGFGLCWIIPHDVAKIRSILLKSACQDDGFIQFHSSFRIEGKRVRFFDCTHNSKIPRVNKGF